MKIDAQLILTMSVLISAVCMGIYTITDDGKLLYFLRKPIIKIIDAVNDLEDEINGWIRLIGEQAGSLREIKKQIEKYDAEFLNTTWCGRESYLQQIRETTTLIMESEKAIAEAKTELRFKRVIIYIFKPIIICPPCMASFWGIIVFGSLYKINSIDSVIVLAMAAVSASFLNHLFTKLYFYND